MNKKIITIAEIVFALVFVVLLAVFMATINSKGNQANNQLIDTLDSTGGTSITKYETMDNVKGTVVVNAVQNYTTLSSDAKLTVGVATKQGSVKLYGYDSKGEPHAMYNEVSTSDDYINPKADFTVKVVRNNNDVIVGLAFAQKDAKVTLETIAKDYILNDSKNIK